MKQKIKDLLTSELDIDFSCGINAYTVYDHNINDVIDKIVKLLPIHDVINWVAFDFMKLETRPPKYGKYLITRKDGKIHWETWNGSGWAYNHKEIRYWAVIKPPCL